MEHFIAYHSAQRMGYEFEPSEELCFLSRKFGLLKKAVGNAVWVVQGIPDGTKTIFFLCGAYIADRVDAEDSSSSQYIISGHRIKEFSPPVLLNNLGWFPAFLKSQSNFSLGFNRLSDKIIVQALDSIHAKNHSTPFTSVPNVDLSTAETEVAMHREDPAFAASMMERLCPSPADRLLVLRQLLSSIKIAEQISSDVWALTLFDNWFRLNVGQVEVMTYRTVARYSPNLFEIRLLLHGGISSALQQLIDNDSDTHGIIFSNYKSVPQPQSFYVGLGELLNGALSSDSHRKIETALRLAAPLHAEFIRLAAHSLSGAVRKASSFRRTHSPGLYAYAQSFVRENSMAPSVSNGKVPGVEENWLFQEELPPDQPLVEGAGIIVKVSAFERNPVARRRCIAHYGSTCVVCGFSFGAAYGSTADGYIHVHHLMPLASIGKEYVVDPVKDLRPVCPNCHAVIHRRQPPQPPYSIDEVKRMLRGEADT